PHPPPTAISTLPLHDALPIFSSVSSTASGSGPAGALDVPATSESSTSWRPASRSRRGGLAGASSRVASSTRGTSTTIGAAAGTRSEEHTSELQSLRHLVCRLL